MEGDRATLDGYCIVCKQSGLPVHDPSTDYPTLGRHYGADGHHICPGSGSQPGRKPDSKAESVQH